MTPTEIELARLWSDLLERTNISRFDSFLETGVDSLLALKLSNRIQRTPFTNSIDQGHLLISDAFDIC